MENFISYWQSGLGMILSHWSIFLLTCASFIIGISYDKIEGERTKHYFFKKKYFSTLAFIAFLIVWVAMMIYMVEEGYM